MGFLSFDYMRVEELVVVAYRSRSERPQRPPPQADYMDMRIEELVVVAYGGPSEWPQRLLSWSQVRFADWEFPERDVSVPYLCTDLLPSLVVVAYRVPFWWGLEPHSGRDMSFLVVFCYSPIPYRHIFCLTRSIDHRLSPPSSASMFLAAFDWSSGPWTEFRALRALKMQNIEVQLAFQGNWRFRVSGKQCLWKLEFLRRCDAFLCACGDEVMLGDIF